VDDLDVDLDRGVVDASEGVDAEGGEIDGSVEGGDGVGGLGAGGFEDFVGDGFGGGGAVGEVVLDSKVLLGAWLEWEMC